MFSRIGSAAFKKDLTNIRILCEKFGNPQAKFKSIHIAGTNGKGSVSHMLAAILQTADYKTGLYTSINNPKIALTMCLWNAKKLSRNFKKLLLIYHLNLKD